MAEAPTDDPELKLEWQNNVARLDPIVKQMLQDCDEFHQNSSDTFSRDIEFPWLEEYDGFTKHGPTYKHVKLHRFPGEDKIGFRIGYTALSVSQGRDQWFRFHVKFSSTSIVHKLDLPSDAFEHVFSNYPHNGLNTHWDGFINNTYRAGTGYYGGTVYHYNHSVMSATLARFLLVMKVFLKTTDDVIKNTLTNFMLENRSDSWKGRYVRYLEQENAQLRARLLRDGCKL